MSRTSRPVLLLVALVWLPTAVSAADDPQAPRAITTLGEHKLFDGKLTVKASEQDGKLTYRITRIGRWGTETLNTATDVTKEGAVWVIVAESPDKFWVFWNGALNKWEFADSDQGRNSTCKVTTGPAILKEAPKAV